jgi:hypothetical protein
MAGCDVLYYDPAQARCDPAGSLLGSPTDRWHPCTAPGQAWTDPELVLRWICPRHRRQLTALCAAGLAGQVRGQRPGLITGQAPSKEAMS